MNPLPDGMVYVLRQACSGHLQRLLPVFFLKHTIHRFFCLTGEIDLFVGREGFLAMANPVRPSLTETKTETATKIGNILKRE